MGKVKASSRGQSARRRGLQESGGSALALCDGGKGPLRLAGKRRSWGALESQRQLLTGGCYTLHSAQQFALSIHCHALSLAYQAGMWPHFMAEKLK